MSEVRRTGPKAVTRRCIGLVAVPCLDWACHPGAGGRHAIETVETLYLLGEQDRIVGISGYCVRPPEARRDKPGNDPS